jgi:hypothetical protein
MNISVILLSISQAVDIFVNELRWEESNGVKRDKLRALQLSNEEWGRVNTFLGLLAVFLILFMWFNG